MQLCTSWGDHVSGNCYGVNVVFILIQSPLTMYSMCAICEEMGLHRIGTGTRRNAYLYLKCLTSEWVSKPMTS